MKPINYFYKRLDEIFEQGQPTKAQIIDAFYKANNFSNKKWTDEDVENMIEYYNKWNKKGKVTSKFVVAVFNFEKHSKAEAIKMVFNDLLNDQTKKEDM